MRVALTSRDQFLPVVEPTLFRLKRIIELISKNPSNPRFNHYVFETLSTIIRFVCSSNPGLVSAFENALFEPFQMILQTDVAEFMPYVFQILSQLLELHTETGIPPSYQAMLPPLLQPGPWENTGNIPALISLLDSYLHKGSDFVVSNGHLVAFLGICHKLISSRINDHHGFVLLTCLFTHVPISSLEPFVKNVFVLLLTRLSQSKTAKFTREFLNFVTYLVVLDKPGFGVDAIVSVFDSLQASPLFCPILQTVLIPEMPLVLPMDRKQVAIGMTRMLTESMALMDQYVAAWTLLLESLVKMIELPIEKAAQKTRHEGTDEDLAVLDLEEAGYQPSFAKLATASKSKVDVTEKYPDPKVFLATSLSRLMQTHPGKFSSIIQQKLPSDAVLSLSGYMQAAGVTLLR